MTPDDLRPPTFAQDRAGSDAEDYESDGGDPAGPKNPNAPEVEEEDEEEAPTRVAAGGAGMSSGPCPKVTVRDWTDDHDVNDVRIVEAPRAAMDHLGAADEEGVQNSRLVVSQLGAADPTPDDGGTTRR